MIRGDIKRFSWMWAGIEVLILLVTATAVWTGAWPRVALWVIGPLVAVGLLVEAARYYKTTVR